MAKKKMDKEAVKRIQRTTDKKPGSKTAKTEFTKRAQRTIDKKKR